MNIVASQAWIFVVAVGTGAGLFFLYDWFCVFRRVKPHQLAAIAIEDILYWVIWTVVVFYLLNQIDNGMLRGFSLGGIGLGMTAYYFLLSRWFIAASVFILRGIAKLLCPFGRYIKNKTGKTVRTMKKELQNGARTIKMGLCKL